MIRKTLYFCKLVTMTSYLPENQLQRENATCKNVMTYADAFDVYGLSKMISAKCSSSGLIFTKVT